MGELVMTKNEGRLDFLDESIRFMAEGGGILKAEEFVAKEQQAHPGMDTTSCYHKIVMARYFGLVLFNNYSSYYFLTESGTIYSRATSKESKIDAILKALTSVTFGRNNNAVNSNSDIEAPVVMLKAISLMGSASMTQIGLILYYMDAHGKTLSEAIDEVVACEDQSGLRRKLTENQNSKYFDVKFNKLFFELGIVEKEQGNYVLSKYVKDKHLDFINALPDLKPIISKDKKNPEDINDTDYNDIFSHDVYGIHIKKENDALSEDRPHICIGWSGMGDLSDVTTKDELRARYDHSWPNEKSKKKGQDIGQVWRFTKEMKVGDYVVFADGDICHIGRIDSDYYFDSNTYENQDSDYTNARKVIWLKKNINRGNLSKAFHHSLMTAMSVWTLNDYKSAIYELLNGTYVKDEIDIEDIQIEADDIEKKYTVEELGDILYQMYESAENKTTAIHMFGFKYAEAIISQGYTAAKIVKASKLQDSYQVEVGKGISIYKSVKENEYGVRFYEPEDCILEVEIPAVAFDFDAVSGKGINKVFYGTPGCGKSYYIDHDILGKDKETKKYLGDYAENNIIRTTFYQDYSNTDFVGQILPKITKGENGEKDIVEYVFTPGPFTLALIQAISNPDKKVALVIEEINRGNAPAIFGDIFQLLDREKNSASEYGIVNVNMIDYLSGLEFSVNGEKKRYTFSEIKIPGNMDIFATMNTSDQNVYTLDTAFVRRWEKEKIKNSFAKCAFAGLPVPGMPTYSWKKFATAINNCISRHLEDLQINEDKQIGAFFVKQELLEKNDAEKFAYKVFDYLWNDVAKLDRNIIFKHYNTLDDLIAAYKKDGIAVFNSDVFVEKEIAQDE